MVTSNFFRNSAVIDADSEKKVEEILNIRMPTSLDI